MYMQCARAHAWRGGAIPAGRAIDLRGVTTETWPRGHEEMAGAVAAYSGLFVACFVPTIVRRGLPVASRSLRVRGGAPVATAHDEMPRLGRYIDSIDEAAAALRAGTLVAFPTETVYGLGAHAFDAAAIANVFAFKGRPASDPLIVHVPTAAAAEKLIELDPAGLALMRQLMADFWPGPLTLVAPACAALPPAVTAGSGFVGVRCPAHPRANELLVAAGVPVAAPSANRFGHVSPTRAEHVMDDLGEHPILVLRPGARADGADGADGGDACCDVGIESTGEDGPDTPRPRSRPSRPPRARARARVRGWSAVA